MKTRTDTTTACTFGALRKASNDISLHKSNYCHYHLILIAVSTTKVYQTSYKLDSTESGKSS